MNEPLLVRSSEEVARFLEGMEMVDPGIVAINEWRPETTPEGKVMHYAAAAAKR